MNVLTGGSVGRLLIVLVGGGLGACQLLGPTCSMVNPAGVRVTVVDSITGAFLEGEGVTVRVIDGEYVDSAAAFPGGMYSAAYERGGMYRVEVTAPGCHLWVREPVEVQRDECGVVTTKVVARMVREGELPPPVATAARQK